MFKKVISFIVKPSEKGNIVSTISGLLTIAALTAPFVRRGDNGQSYYSAFEYAYTFYSTLDSLSFLALAVIMTGFVSIFTIIRPSRCSSIASLSAIAILLVAFAASSITFAGSLAGAYIIVCGLLIQSAGVFRR